jgi:ABC-type nitrate/sulfonate/bicarbonate transport system permease component
VIGVVLGIVIARVRLARSLLQPPLSLLGTLPLLILLPFITLWFGTARLAQAGLVILFTMLTVAFASASAAEVVSEQYANYASCLGASRHRVLWTVILPASGPAVVAALRVALAAGWGWEAVAELLGGRSGIGRIIQLTAQLGAVADLMATVLCLAIVALICDALLAAGGGYLVRWRE